MSTELRPIEGFQFTADNFRSNKEASLLRFHQTTGPCFQITTGPEGYICFDIPEAERLIETLSEAIDEYDEQRREKRHADIADADTVDVSDPRNAVGYGIPTPCPTSSVEFDPIAIAAAKVRGAVDRIPTFRPPSSDLYAFDIQDYYGASFTLTQRNPTDADGRPIPIHLDVTPYVKGLTPSSGPTREQSYQMACGNGSYHVRFTKYPELVTCPECLKKFDHDEVTNCIATLNDMVTHTNKQATGILVARCEGSPTTTSTCSRHEAMLELERWVTYGGECPFSPEHEAEFRAGISFNKALDAQTDLHSGKDIELVSGRDAFAFTHDA